MKRAFATLCPSCGAQVAFASGDSVLVVCPYCTSTLVRSGDALENLGRMAELFDDHSPLQLGARGTASGHRAFALIGRLQIRYDGGIWNEWRLLYDDGEPGWLSEDNGQYVLLDDAAAPDEQFARDKTTWLPFERMTLDSVHPYGDIVWRVVNREAATIVAGEGELPFRIGAGLPVRVIDLRGPGEEFATLDYPAPSPSDPTGAGGPPLFYRGRAVRLVDLKLDGLRTEVMRKVTTEAFACSKCGAPVQPTLATTRSITCPSCRVVIDLSGASGARIRHWQQKGKAVRPAIPLQSTARFDGMDWTVVGFQRREMTVDGTVYHWDEYLLFEPLRGFRFLVESDGHWSWVEVLQRAVTRIRGRNGRGVLRHDDERFDEFSRYESRVRWVQGEFYWRVGAGDRARHEDYIAPPRMLSREETDTEITWSLGRYLSADEINAAFPKLKPPAWQPGSIGAIQPAPASWRKAHLALAAVVLVSLLLLQAFLWLRGSQIELAAPQQLIPGSAAYSDTLITVPGPGDVNLVIRTDASITNQYFDVEAEVAARGMAANGAGAATRRWASVTAVAFHEGRDADGYWSEGSRTERLVFKVPPGDYLVRVRASAVQPPAAGQTVVTYSIAQSSRPSWFFFLIALGVLAVLNLIGVVGSPDPESERWAESTWGTRPGRPAST